MCWRKRDREKERKCQKVSIDAESDAKVGTSGEERRNHRRVSLKIQENY